VRAGPLLLLLAVGCASTAQRKPLPALPPLVQLGELLPPAVPAPRKGKLERYPDTPVDPGECKNLPGGILVSDASYDELTEAVIDRRRFRLESDTLLRLRNEEYRIALRIEEAYVARVALLERELAAEQRGSRWKYLATALVSATIVVVAVLAAKPLVR
jgi:hypothetical protein